ncbi:MAG: ASKHA domain-containing protein [Mahellales bacterium]|jgi:uncharacterized 2Fe-2S/4Fe-4S cluster protein (DUF4445 family)
MKEYSVTFLPEEIAVRVKQGTNLLRAAKRAGIEVETPCGCKGTCGKCLVILKQGNVDEKARTRVTDDLRDKGYILGCQVQVNDDLVVEVPKQSRVSHHQVLVASKRNGFSKENDYFKDRPFNPFCKKVHIVMEPPSLTDNISDLDRLERSLKRSMEYSSLDISLECLRKLSNITREGNWEVTVSIVEYKGRATIIDIEPGRSKKLPLGIAVDIGTTTIAINLINTQNGKIIDQAGAYNKQSRYGTDIISRIVFAEEKNNGVHKLKSSVVDTINQLIQELLIKNNLEADDILTMVCAGNTVMTHMLLGLPPEHIRLEPYIPTASVYPVLKAEQLGVNINKSGLVINLPSVSSYVGGDIVAGVLATQLWRSDKITLFIDIGTNGELVLGNKDWLVTCSCSAGPAFEGSGITCGMRAMDGAINRIRIGPDLEAECFTINNKPPLGICGSGLIYSISQLKEAGIINRAGSFQMDRHINRLRMTDNGPEYVLVWAEDSGTGKDIVITENDIKNLIRSKGAIFAGIKTMVEQMNLGFDAIERVYIAGGFGNFIDIEDAIAIGLFPDINRSLFEYVGNSSIQGASMVLLSQEALAEAENLSRRMTYLELSVGNMFMDEFISALFLPHTDLTLFKSAC